MSGSFTLLLRIHATQEIGSFWIYFQYFDSGFPDWALRTRSVRGEWMGIGLGTMRPTTFFAGIQAVP